MQLSCGPIALMCTICSVHSPRPDCPSGSLHIKSWSNFSGSGGRMQVLYVGTMLGSAAGLLQESV